jgi:hemerythrin
MNVLIHWKEKYNVNIKEIDQQHKKLIDMINVLHDAIIRKEDKNIMAQIISDMRDYAFIHFKTEEKYFSLIGHKDAESHKAEHNFFLEHVEIFYEEFQNYDSSLAVEVMTFLKDWFINHIVQLDKTYAAKLFDNGIQ